MLAVDFVEFWNHPQRIFQRLGNLRRGIDARSLALISLQHAGLRLSPPPMLLAFGFLFSPEIVAELYASSVALHDRNTAVPIIRRSIVALAVLLVGDACGGVSLDSLGLFIESLGANANGDALALLGRVRSARSSRLRLAVA